VKKKIRADFDMSDRTIPLSDGRIGRSSHEVGLIHNMQVHFMAALYKAVTS
jgi:hypothetical protein